MINNILLDTLYFGKFPARGDFIKSNGYSHLIHEIDVWLSASFKDVEMNEARKQRYLAIDTLYFSKVGFMEEPSIIGAIIPSRDTSGRLFPMLFAGLKTFSKPKALIQHLPIESKLAWQSCFTILKNLINTPKSEEAIQLLKEVSINFATDSTVDYYDFLRVTSILRINQYYEHREPSYSFANNLIALGLLFQPVVSQGFTNLKKCLRFYLATTEDNALLIATFWLDMLSSFIREHQVELLCIVTKQKDGWYLLTSFHGFEEKLLNSVISQNWHDDGWIDMDSSTWIEDYIEKDAGLTQFNDILADETQSLFEVRNLFKEIFTGE